MLSNLSSIIAIDEMSIDEIISILLVSEVNISNFSLFQDLEKDNFNVSDVSHRFQSISPHD